MHSVVVSLTKCRPMPALQDQPLETVEIDQWIVDFAHLFRDLAGLDFDRHVELNNMGWDKIQVRAAAPIISA